MTELICKKCDKSLGEPSQTKVDEHVKKFPKHTEFEERPEWLNKSEISGYNKAIDNLVKAGILSSADLVQLWRYTTSQQKQDEYFEKI